MALDLVEILVFVILPYLAITCFIIGVIYRVLLWTRAPSAANAFTVFPGVTGGKGKLAFEVSKEITTFSRLFKADKKLWVGAWFLHFGILMALIGHTRLLFEWPFVWEILDFDSDTKDNITLISGSLAGLVILATLVYLLLRRLRGAVYQTSNIEDYFVLLLLLNIGITGMAMRLFEHVEMESYREWLGDFLLLRMPTVVPELGLYLLLHFLSVLLLIALLPYTKLFHLGGVFITMRLSKYRLPEAQL